MKHYYYSYQEEDFYTVIIMSNCQNTKVNTTYLQITIAAYIYTVRMVVMVRIALCHCMTHKHMHLAGEVPFPICERTAREWREKYICIWEVQVTHMIRFYSQDENC